MFVNAIEMVFERYGPGLLMFAVYIAFGSKLCIVSFINA